ncbi:RagB/SusD family nutrient uptake outer membrane protein [Maribellus sp. YY47]|uniref:RagB/SusD family nutrient uptake outer membrane protein n=1 Tax=Maribellus sp. YY47 TaxID=2929486 RepID=UPI0020009666|nr:RagB/SusD family nutrient uptake outer membrane protein [Maribellus sp. YY47]MCK3683225.1 RagB/SusD family nutrient uptake outer membrane protein [Maribellus sp. YY47]
MKNIIKLGFLMMVVTAVWSCSEIEFGDEFLGTAPEVNETTLDSMFSSKLYAEKVLTQAYTYLPYGIPTGTDGANNKLGLNLLESLTDLNSSFRDNASDGPTKLYYNGSLNASHSSAGNEAYRYGAEDDWSAIRYAWFYLENVDRVPDMTAAEKAERAAEAKMILAISYAEMLRYIGGFPYLNHAVEPTETMEYPRLSFEQSVDTIISLIDQALPHLNWIMAGDDDGRMNKAGAYGLKLRVQLFAASPTFNSSSPWHPQADEYTRYATGDASRWEDAKKTAEEFINALNSNGYYDLIQPSEDTHEARRLAYRQAYYQRGGTEVLISTRKGSATSLHDQMITNYSLYWGPTLNYVNMFPWADGSDFEEDFDWENPSKQPFFEGKTPTRDPRLYETVAVPGDIYKSGTVVTTYSNHANYKVTSTGFMMMKFVLQQAADRTTRPHWPYLRLPEVYLSYAEILNQVNGGPNAVAYEYVNKVRNRVGLSNLPTGMSQAEFREAVLRERALEFGYEEVRWFDLVRYGRVSDFKKTLYGLESVGNDDLNPTAFTFEQKDLIGIHTRYWKTNWDTKWYLAPIPLVEINKNYGMTQNPGW